MTASAEIANPEDLRKAAIALDVQDTKNISTSYIQRKLGIGYNRAARILETLESAAIVSTRDHAGKRTIIDPDALHRLALGQDLVGQSQSHVEPTVSITTADGTSTGPVPMSVMQQALDTMRGRKKPPFKEDPDFKKHNQDPYAVTAEELRQFIERYEQMESEKKDVATQQKDLMGEAKGRGYDTRVMRKVIALRKRKPDELAEEEAVLELYKAALGMT